MKDTVQELVDALDVTSILERVRDTWILRLKLNPETSEFSNIILEEYFPNNT